jgi:xylulokinase
MKFIAWDLGTGGVKASLYDGALNTLAKTFIEYGTYYPGPLRHEQRPEDWWQGVVASTKELMGKTGTKPEEISCVALSGHSLVTVPVAADGALMMEQTPIWSDARAVEETEDFFAEIPYEYWYMSTGNGFPPQCYSIFKLMNLKKTEPELFAKIHKVLGSKDYINFKLTGVIATDISYASGSGGYDLKSAKLAPEFWDAAGIDPSIYPELVTPHTVIGRITQDAAYEIGLAAGTPVAAGGVDNACMALGAVGQTEGGVYLSLGSSSWIALTSKEPLLDVEKRPYVFAQLADGKFTSAFSIFSAGTSLKWVRDNICADLTGARSFTTMDEIAATSPPGAGGVFFNPSLGGGNLQEKSLNIRGAYIGLNLGATKADLIRAALEGIAMNLNVSYEYMKEHAAVGDRLMVNGGGSKSAFWLRIFADVFGTGIIKTNIDQDCASIGAAAVCARAVGLWRDYAGINSLHKVEFSCEPDPVNRKIYTELNHKFRDVSDTLSDLGDRLAV